MKQMLKLLTLLTTILLMGTLFPQSFAVTKPFTTKLSSDNVSLAKSLQLLFL